MGQKQSSMKTFPPRTSLDSNRIGLWPASAKYLAVDKPAKPAIICKIILYSATIKGKWKEKWKKKSNDPLS